MTQPYNLRIIGAVSGQTLLGVIYNSAGQIWIGGNNFEAPSSIATAAWSSTVNTVSYTEGKDASNVGQGDYFASFPTAITSPDDYTIKAVVSPLTSGQLAIASQFMAWSGTAEVENLAIIAAISADTVELVPLIGLTPLGLFTVSLTSGGKTIASGISSVLLTVDVITAGVATNLFSGEAMTEASAQAGTYTYQGEPVTTGTQLLFVLNVNSGALVFTQRLLVAP